jgi:hypothetical protein
MHDQAASRISGRTRAAVSAMCVRAVRITVLKSAGNFTRGECHHLNAEEIQPVKCFMFTGAEFVARQQFSNAGAAGRVQKFQPSVNWRTWRFTSPVPLTTSAAARFEITPCDSVLTSSADTGALYLGRKQEEGLSGQALPLRAESTVSPHLLSGAASAAYWSCQFHHL